jgi:hypothetical protein
MNRGHGGSRLALPCSFCVPRSRFIIVIERVHRSRLIADSKITRLAKDHIRFRQWPVYEAQSLSKKTQESGKKARDRKVSCEINFPRGGFRHLNILKAQ